MGEKSGEGDHTGVVGSERRPGEAEFNSFVLAGEAEFFLKRFIAGDTSGKGDDFVARFFGGEEGFTDQGIDDGGLEGGANVGKLRLWVVELLELVKNGGLEAGE